MFRPAQVSEYRDLWHPSKANCIVGAMNPISVPAGMPRCSFFQVFANGQPVNVLSVGIASIARLEMDGPVEIEVRGKGPIVRGEIRPRRLGIPITVAEGKATFTFDEPRNIWIDVSGGGPPLYLFAFGPEENIPRPSDPNVVYFRGGRIHEAGTVELHEGQTLYIEGGAVVRGLVRAVGVSGVSIRGRGILDGTFDRATSPIPDRRMVVLEECRGARIADITMIHPTTWMVMLTACQDVRIQNLHEVGEVISSDGVDVVGSRGVTIDGCFLRNNDDCVVAKAFDGRGNNPDFTVDGGRDIADLLVQNCTFWNDGGGNAMEIGFELRTASVRNIVFRNIDVLAAHGPGAVFSIHVGDRATVSDVLWEDIRVEHYWDFLIDFRILASRWSKDTVRGHIRNITLRRIQTIPDIYNIPSLIGGFDSDHLVENVRIEELHIGERHVQNADDLHLFTNQHCRGIQFY
jgi:hypothetical protein